MSVANFPRSPRNVFGSHDPFLLNIARYHTVH